MKRSIHRVLLVALAVGACSLSTSFATAQPVGKTYVTSGCNGAAFKPSRIIIACGDAGLVATKLHWSEWGSSKAAGAGTGEERVCTPNCAEGSVVKGEMKVSLFRARLCPQDGKRHFTKLHYVWPGGAPGEGRKQDTIPLPCSLLSSPY